MARPHKNLMYACLNSSPFFDVNAGGQWVCGNNDYLGDISNESQKTFCASCPPCVTERFATRLVARDTAPFCDNDMTSEEIYTNNALDMPFWGGGASEFDDCSELNEVNLFAPNEPACVELSNPVWLR